MYQGELKLVMSFVSRYVSCNRPGGDCCEIQGRRFLPVGLGDAPGGNPPEAHSLRASVVFQSRTVVKESGLCENLNSNTWVSPTCSLYLWDSSAMRYVSRTGGRSLPAPETPVKLGGVPARLLASARTLLYNAHEN